MVHRKGLVCIFALGENYGFATVQPVATDSPQDCRIYSFESLPARSAKENRGYPVGILCFLWYTGRDSNPQPSEPESDALSIEPPVHVPVYYNRLSPFCKGENVYSLPTFFVRNGRLMVVFLPFM